jgi:hypothetical protein
MTDQTTADERARRNFNGTRIFIPSSTPATLAGSVLLGFRRTSSDRVHHRCSQGKHGMVAL